MWRWLCVSVWRRENFPIFFEDNRRFRNRLFSSISPGIYRDDFGLSKSNGGYAALLSIHNHRRSSSVGAEKKCAHIQREKGTSIECQQMRYMRNASGFTIQIKMFAIQHTFSHIRNWQQCYIANVLYVAQERRASLEERKETKVDWIVAKRVLY